MERLFMAKTHTRGKIHEGGAALTFKQNMST